MIQQSLFDDPETPASSLADPSSRRASGPAPEERAAWEDWKARMLPGFVAPYCRALADSRLHRSCWWVDGLALSGRGHPGAPGDPVASKIAEALAASHFTLHVLRLDLHPSKRKHQEAAPVPANAATAGDLARPATKNGRKREPEPTQEIPASVSREELPARLGTAPAVILLNLFATPPLTAETLLPLCQRQAPTELLLTISAAQLEHLAGQSLAAPRQEDAPPPALTALLRSDSWKAIWTSQESRTEKVTRTLEVLRGLLKPFFLYLCLVPLDEAPTLSRFLLFASRQYAGLALMNDFLYAEQARLAHERERRALQGAWFAQRRAAARAAAWAALKDELHTLGRLRRARLWPDLKPALVLAHFGQFSTAEYDAALLELLREGRVQCRWSPATAQASAPDTPDTPPNERIPGQQDFLEFIEPKTRPVWRR